MKSRKLLLPLAAFGLLVGLVGCNNNNSKSESKEESSQSQQPSSAQPSSSSEAPAQSSEQPAVSSEEPAVSSETPVESSEAPVESSEAPVESSEEPVESSEAPVESSSAAPIKMTVSAADNKKKLIIGEMVQLTASADGVALEGVTWESKKPEIAMVSTAGIVIAVNKGSAQIVASKDGYTNATISITVDYESITVTATENKTTLVTEETVQLTADKDGVTWGTSAEAVATVSDAGLVTAVAPGTAVISASKELHNAGKVTITVTRPAALAVLHMEDADHYSADGWWGTAAEGVTPIYERSSGNASDAQCIAHFGAGDKETLAFTSDAAFKAELVLTMASSSEIADMGAVMSVKFNNADVSIANKDFAGGSSSEFSEFSLGELDVVNGDNTLELTFLEADAYPYLDDLAIYGKAQATIAVKAAPARETIVPANETMTVNIGEQEQIVLTKPESLEGVSYVSDKESVATVSEDGKVTGVALGTANITIKKDGWYSARIEVTVEKKIESGEIRVEAENTANELPGGFHKYTDRTQGISNGHSGSAYITGYDVNSACSLEYTFPSDKAQTMTLIIAGAPHYQMTEPFNFATDCVIKLNGEVITVNPEAQIEPGSTMGAATVEVTIGDVDVIQGDNTFVIEFAEKAPALDCYRFMPKAA